MELPSSQSLSRSGSNISGTAVYTLEDIFTSNSNGLWSKKLATGDDVIWGDIFAHDAPFTNNDCQDQGVANPPWGWHDQFDHSVNAIINLMTQAGFCQSINTTFLYNPYSDDPLPACASPQNLTIANVNDFGSTLDWNDVPGALFYRIYYKKNTETQWKETTSTQSTFVLTNLDPNTAYDVRVASNCNMASIEASFTTTCVVCSCIKTDIIINIDQVFNVALVSGDIIIKSGNTLTINSHVQFNRNSSIIVEHGARLILEEATLTSCHPNYKWDGILVYGNPFSVQGFPGNPSFSPGGVVEVKTSSIIENAIIGINTSNPISGGMFGYFNWSGGLVTVSNSTIRNCDIGVNFGPYGFTSEFYSLEDQSYFNNANFSNCDYAVKIVNNLGIEFDYSTMTLVGEGIECINSKIDVDNNCIINDGAYGIAFYNTWPSVLGSDIKNSSFNNVNDVYWESTGNATPYIVEDNTFNGLSGVFGFGLSEFNNQRNTYNYNIEGLATWETGLDQRNLVEENNFTHTEYATSVYGINNQEYNDNCFAFSGVSDIELYGEATSIFEKQGDEVDAANNCFYGYAEAITTSANTTEFEYFMKKYTIFQDCKHPGYSLTSNYLLNEEFESNQPFFDCGNNFAPPTTIRNRWCNIPNTLAAMLQMEVNLNQEILNIQNSTSLTPIAKKRLIALKKRCLKKLIHTIIIQKLQNEGRESAISYALMQPDFDIKIMGYSFVAETGDYNRASTVIDELPTSRSAESEFKQAQNIYLSYLKDRRNFALSSTQKNSLESIANNQNELSGFARSIYYILTGEKIRIRLDHVLPSTPRSREEQALDKLIHIYPNLSYDGEFNIELLNEHHIYPKNMEVFDLSGRIIHSQKLKGEINHFHIEKSGMYIIKIYENNIEVHHQKIVKI